ncbi:MAG TPA: energy transducer TonB [Candidatus Saccharimonadales bacterium]|jgi:protein TonB|nr:energy transducer TonB [Candidatus Saccharimonadales bacterium]
MFLESLVESSPEKRRRSPWPIATAFFTQLLVAGVLLLLPLFSLGVIPLVLHIPTITPLAAPPVVEASVSGPSGGGGGGGPYPPFAQPTVVLGGRSCRLCPSENPLVDDSKSGPDFDLGRRTGDRFPGDPSKGKGPGVDLGGKKERPRISHIDEGLLTQKVTPVYPVIASRTGIQGDVKLYAIIARDGSIENLKLISGHPLLVTAAMDAVAQWKYKPYILNGEPVEVETYITVTFRKGN